MEGGGKGGPGKCDPLQPVPTSGHCFFLQGRTRIDPAVPLWIQALEADVDGIERPDEGAEEFVELGAFSLKPVPEQRLRMTDETEIANLDCTVMTIRVDDWEGGCAGAVRFDVGVCEGEDLVEREEGRHSRLFLMDRCR